jgi:hypothetical protein
MLLGLLYRLQQVTELHLALVVVLGRLLYDVCCYLLVLTTAGHCCCCCCCCQVWEVQWGRDGYKGTPKVMDLKGHKSQVGGVGGGVMLLMLLIWRGGASRL